MTILKQKQNLKPHNKAQCSRLHKQTNNRTNTVVLVLEQTTPTEPKSLVGEVIEGLHWECKSFYSIMLHLAHEQFHLLLLIQHSSISLHSSISAPCNVPQNGPGNALSHFLSTRSFVLNIALCWLKRKKGRYWFNLEINSEYFTIILLEDLTGVRLLHLKNRMCKQLQKVFNSVPIDSILDLC
jgi:hypothetical protein